MRATARVRGAVPLLLLTVIGCAASPPTPPAQLRHAGDELRSAIETHVDDVARRKEAVAEVQRLTQELEAFGHEVETWKGQVQDLLTDYRATRREIEQVLAVAASGRERIRARILDTRLALATVLTPDEWRAVAAADTALVTQWAAASTLQ